MGSGKTTVGRKLAALKNWNFIDLDEEIEKRLGKSINAIFSEHGEEFFRIKEAETLRSLNILSPAVISVGGGAPCHHDNMNYMLQTGKVVYLKMNPEEIKKRVANESWKRPLLKNLDTGSIDEFIRNKLKEREPFYSRAHIIADGNDPEIPSLLNFLIEKHISGDLKKEH